jgi:transcriptional regulator with XRE-family HTH domain
MNVPEILKAILETTGWSQGKLAEKLGANQNDVSRWLRGREPRGQSMEAIRTLARQYGLLDRSGAQTIPIIGLVGAGGEIAPDLDDVPDEGVEAIELSAPIGIVDNPVGYRVNGEYLYPRFSDNDYLIVEREEVCPFITLVGQVAVVRIGEGKGAGKRFVMRIMPGPTPETFNLESIDRNTPTIIGARLDWASLVKVIVPAAGLGRVRQNSRT